jgi:hypothetical protein
MSPNKPVSVEFEPVRIGRRSRRIDPVALGLIVVVAAVLAAVVKPWGGADPGVATGSGATAGGSPTAEPPDPTPDPGMPTVGLLPPTWLNVGQVAARRDAWGIRAIVLGPVPGASPGAPPAYSERWDAVAVDARAAPAIVDARDADVIALGITFPPTEAPLAVRIWLDHGNRDLEWIDARPVDEVPARGAYLLLRSSAMASPPRAWEPGRYRVDVLVGGAIRRIGVEILDRSGALPAPRPWADAVPEGPDLPGTGPASLPVGLFAWVAATAVPLSSEAGPALEETEAWLDLDRRAADAPPRSFVARAHQPSATWLGVVLPPASVVLSAVVGQIAPFEVSADVGGATMTTSGERLSFVAFARPGGAAWRPGVYSLRVDWVDGDGAHDQTWHVELRPGRVLAEPVLLSATRAWAGLAGSAGILLGTTGSIDGGAATSGVRLLDIVPQTGGVYAGLGGSSLIGCRDTLIRGVPSVIGFVGPETSDLAPVTATLQFPIADDGPLPVLTAAGAVPGLAIAAPVLTAEFGGPALYGFRAGSSADAPGYTICIGMAPPAR